jgi:hypothetical protein
VSYTQRNVHRKNRHVPFSNHEHPPPPNPFHFQISNLNPAISLFFWALQGSVILRFYTRFPLLCIKLKIFSLIFASLFCLHVSLHMCLTILPIVFASLPFVFCHKCQSLTVPTSLHTPPNFALSYFPPYHSIQSSWSCTMTCTISPSYNKITYNTYINLFKKAVFRGLFGTAYCTLTPGTSFLHH